MFSSRSFQRVFSRSLILIPQNSLARRGEAAHRERKLVSDSFRHALSWKDSLWGKLDHFERFEASSSLGGLGRSEVWRSRSKSFMVIPQPYIREYYRRRRHRKARCRQKRDNDDGNRKLKGFMGFKKGEEGEAEKRKPRRGIGYLVEVAEETQQTKNQIRSKMDLLW